MTGSIYYWTEHRANRGGGQITPRSEIKILREDNEETGRASDGKTEDTFSHAKFQVLVAHSEEIVIRL